MEPKIIIDVQKRKLLFYSDMLPDDATAYGLNIVYIPKAWYERDEFDLALTESPRFKARFQAFLARHPEIIVPFGSYGAVMPRMMTPGGGHTNLLIHFGQTKYDSEGCLLVSAPAIVQVNQLCTLLGDEKSQPLLLTLLRSRAWDAKALATALYIQLVCGV